MNEDASNFAEDVAIRLRKLNFLRPKEIAIVRDVMWEMMGRLNVNITFGEQVLPENVIEMPAPAPQTGAPDGN